MMKKIYIFLVTLFLFNSCVEEIPVGFLSDSIRMREDTLEVVKGLYVMSAIPMIDGSTRPLQFEIIDVKDLRTGAHAQEFFKSYPVKLWSSTYNPDLDTTMALVNKKLFIKEVAPIEINPVSGQLAFNGGTKNLNGDIYGVDVKISNESTSKVYNNFGKIKLINRSWEAVNNFGEYFYGVVATDASPQKDIEIRNPIPVNEMVQVKNNTHPRFSINKVGDSDEVKIKLSFYDTNDQPFPGEAIAKWPKAGAATYLNSWFDNSLDTKILKDGVEFNFPTVPFPAFGREYNNGRNSISLSYYVLHPAYYSLTPQAMAKANAKAAELGKTFTGYNLQAKIVYQINEPGIWEVKVKFMYAIKK